MKNLVNTRCYNRFTVAQATVSSSCNNLVNIIDAGNSASISIIGLLELIIIRLSHNNLTE